jgi:hypothetical protein
VRGHLTATRGRVVGLREQTEKDVLGREPGDEDDGQVAVVGDPDVPAALERVGGPDLAALVSGDRNDERRLALAVQSEGRLVAQTCGEHVPVHRQEVVGAEAEGLV